MTKAAVPRSGSLTGSYEATAAAHLADVQRGLDAIQGNDPSWR